MKTLGEALRELRRDHEFSLRELAQRCDVSPAFIHDIEHNRRHPSPETLEKLAKALGVPTRELDAYDLRPCFESLRERSEREPEFGKVLRTIADPNVTSKRFLSALDSLQTRKAKK